MTSLLPNRDTLVTIAIMIALASTFYLYKELKQTNQDVLNCKTYSQTLSSQIALTSSRQAPAVVVVSKDDHPHKKIDTAVAAVVVDEDLSE